MWTIILSWVTAAALTYFAIPSIIHISRSKKLYDVPVERSSHHAHTPSLGGIAIFAGIIFSVVYFAPFQEYTGLQYIVCAIIILFLIGAKDDLSPVVPYKKLVGQIMAAAILTLKSEVLLHGLYGFMGVHTIPAWASVILTIFTILVITNAFNLIDGIDGLAGSIAALSSATFGVWFYVAGEMGLAVLAFAALGSVVAFLKYNMSPAQLFMGDTGSLLLGLVISVLAISFIDLNAALPIQTPWRITHASAVAVGILILPLFDTLRVFVTRIIRGVPPFEADRRHIHHLLIDAGNTHAEATTVLLAFNMVFISIILGLHDKMELHLLLLLEMSIMAAFTLYFHELVKKKRRLQET
ncbi:MAG: MraY family glycosyltransferase [Saprospiraceae bacterium]